MSELVGLALRSVGSCPIEVELVPDSVERARDAAKRAPLLIISMLCIWALLAAGITYFKQANVTVKQAIAGTTERYDELEGYATELKEWDDAFEQLQGQSRQNEEVVNDRSFWVRVLADLNGRYQTDCVWVTVLEPLKAGTSMTPLLGATAAAQQAIAPGQIIVSALFPPPVALPDAKESANAAPPDATVMPNPTTDKYELRIQGLYRKNDRGVEVVYDFVRSLAQSPFFEIENVTERLNDYCKAESGVDTDRHGYKFEIRVPLKQTIQFKK